MTQVWLSLLLTQAAAAPPPAHPPQADASAREQRARMVEVLRGYDPKVSDRRVLAAMRKVPRHLFVPADQVHRAYEDTPLPIGEGQTISQPYIVALMTEVLRPRSKDRVLEIGTGSGYQAAVLAELVHEVYTIEIVEPLAKRAEGTLREMGYRNVHVRAGDGYRGWPEKAPFDAILVTCAPDHIPQPLVDQLKVGGRMVIPVGTELGPLSLWTAQELVLVRKTKKGMEREKLLDVRFVSMTGEAQKKKPQR